MAAGGGAAAKNSPYFCLFFFINVIFTVAVEHYSRSDLINIGLRCTLRVSSDFHRAFNIPDEIARPAGSPWIVVGSGRSCRRRRERKRRRGCRAGLVRRLKKEPLKPPVPSLYLCTGRASTHETNTLELELEGNRFVRDCCVLLLHEPEAPAQLAGRTLHRWDGRSGGGGLCLYIHQGWCNNSAVLETHSSTDLHFMTVRCRPFYLPRELTVVLITAVCIPPEADVSTAASLLLHSINNHQRAHPEGVHIIAGSFNKADLQSVLPNFHQHVSCPTSGDRVYSNINQAYRGTPLPHVDHRSLFLVPAYSPLCRPVKPTVKTITSWPKGSLHQLQSCFETTRWEVFHHEDLVVFSETVLDYIRFCIGNVTVDKTIRIYPNQKPWMTRQVRMLLHARHSAFRSGNRALYSGARADLRRAIKEAKAAYTRAEEDHPCSNDPHREWQAVPTFTNHRGCSGLEPQTQLPAASSQPTTAVRAAPFILEDVERGLRSVDPRMATGLDGVPGKVLKACAPQLSQIFTDIFNLSLTQASITPCLRLAAMLPIPQNNHSQ